MPLMGDREPLEALAAEYAAGSSIYCQKIDKLKEEYGSIRCKRGWCLFESAHHVVPPVTQLGALCR